MAASLLASVPMVHAPGLSPPVDPAAPGGCDGTYRTPTHQAGFPFPGTCRPRLGRRPQHLCPSRAFSSSFRHDPPSAPQLNPCRCGAAPPPPAPRVQARPSSAPGASAHPPAPPVPRPPPRPARRPPAALGRSRSRARGELLGAAMRSARCRRARSLRPGVSPTWAARRSPASLPRGRPARAARGGDSRPRSRPGPD